MFVLDIVLFSSAGISCLFFVGLFSVHFELDALNNSYNNESSLISENYLSVDVSDQLITKKPWKRFMAVLSLLGIIRNTCSSSTKVDSLPGLVFSYWFFFATRYVTHPLLVLLGHRLLMHLIDSPDK